MARRSFLKLSGSTALLAAGGLRTRAGRAYPAETGKTVRMGVVGGGFGAGFYWHEHPNCTVTGVTDLLKELKERTGLKYMMAESSYYNQECIFARNLHCRGGFGELFYSEVEYYHNFVNMHTHPEKKGTLFRMPDGKRTWRWGLTPMLYPTHSLGYVVGVTKERITKVSCLGWGTGDSPVLKDNRYNNPFWNEAAMMLTDKGHMCRCNVFWKCVAGGERAQWFGEKATLYMVKPGVHGSVSAPEGEVVIPQYWKSDMLPEPMRHASGHGGSAVFISAEFVNALLEDREPACDLYDSLAMTVPGIIAHQSALSGGEQLSVPQFDRPRGA